MKEDDGVGRRADWRHENTNDNFISPPSNPILSPSNSLPSSSPSSFKNNSIVFAFKTASDILIEVGLFWFKTGYDLFFHRLFEKRWLGNKMSNAISFQEWSNAAIRLDEIEKNEKWQSDPISNDYDYELIEHRTWELQKALEDNDTIIMMYLLRMCIYRNFGGICNKKLYDHKNCNLGTKFLIQEFLDKIIKCLDFISEDSNIPLSDRIEFIKNMKKNMGTTVLMLSGGANLGMQHVGVLKSLYEHELLPRIICGSSSGSIVASIVCSKMDCELETFMNLDGINLNFFGIDSFESSFESESKLLKSNQGMKINQNQNENHSLIESDSNEMKSKNRMKSFSRILESGVLLDAEILSMAMRENLGNLTFLEAYNRTGRILNISVSAHSLYEMPFLLNYLTSPDVVIWSAVVASCAVPLFYKSVEILSKCPKSGRIGPWHFSSTTTWIDGSVRNDLPMKGLAEVFNSNHCIASQVNPYIVPILRFMESDSSRLGRFLKKFISLLNSEISFRLKQIKSLGILPVLCDGFEGLLNQSYRGDITILPNQTWKQILSIFSHISRREYKEMIIYGERACWPKIHQIKNSTIVERNLEKILKNLNSKHLSIRTDKKVNFLNGGGSVSMGDLTSRQDWNKSH